MALLKIDVVAPPFHGHLHPILGLARTLRTVAEIRVLSTPDAAARVNAAGFELVPILADHTAEVWSIPNTPQPVRGNPWMLWQQFRRNLKLLPKLRIGVEAAWQARQPDLVLVDFTLPTVGHWAQARGIRWWTAHPSPLAIETRDGTPTYLGGWKPPKTMAGRLRDALGRGGVRHFKRLMFAIHRRELRAIGLPSIYRSDGSEQVYSNELILALGLRELEFPCTWPSAVKFIGPSLYTPPGNEVPPEWDRARKNILITLGTHLPFARKDMLERVKVWARELPETFLHYTTGGDGSTHWPRGDNWKVYRYIDYDRHLARFDGIVHHGGAGIVYSALRAKLPTVVWPQDYDQFDFAARLEHRGLAIHCRSASAIPFALKHALQDATMKKRLQPITDKLRSHDLRAEMLTLMQEQRLAVDSLSA